MPEGDSALGEIVGGKFEGDFIARQDADAIAAKPACKVGQDEPLVFELDTEFTAGEFLDYRSLHFYAVFFTHSDLFILMLLSRLMRIVAKPALAAGRPGPAPHGD